MNGRLAWLVGSGVLVAWGFAGALGGCGSSDANIADSTADGGEAGSGTSGGTSGATSGGTSGNPGNDGGGGTDGSSGGTDGGKTEGGGGDAALTSTPDKIPCGNGLQCTTPAEVCCVTGTGVGSADAGCQAAAAPCAGGSLRCDEKADCTGTAICCAGFGGGTGGSECQATCNMNQAQLCKTNAECTGGTCYANKCPTGPGGATVVVDACSKIPFCTQ
jgi:hypothetical protein